MTRQQRLAKLIREWNAANADTSEGSESNWEAANHALAYYIVKDEKRVVIRGDVSIRSAHRPSASRGTVRA